MKFRRITNLEIDGFSVKDCDELTRFLEALERIEDAPYHGGKNPETLEDFECVRRRVVYEPPNKLVVEEQDIRTPWTKLHYILNFMESD